MFQPGFIGLCRDLLLSYIPFIGGVVCVSLPIQPVRALESRISVPGSSLYKHDLRQPQTDYRPVKLFGKVVAINFGKGYH